MDDMPSPSGESGTGAYDAASSFIPIFQELSRGMRDARPRDIDPEDWDDVKGDIFEEAWKLHCDRPDYFVTGVARRWARSAVPMHHFERWRKKRRRAILEDAYVREVLPGHLDAKVLDELINEERRHAIVGRLRLLASGPQWAVIERLIRGLSRREAAAELGVSEPTIKRQLEAGRRALRVGLWDWDPRRSSKRNRGDHE